MGMFDTIIVPAGLKSKDGTVLCEFQTKSLDNEMATYYIFDNKIFADTRLRGTAGKASTTYALASESVLTIQRVQEAKWQSNLTCVLHMYTHDPSQVVHVLGNGFNDDPRIQPHHPWVEFEIVIVDGKITRSQPSGQDQSVADVQSKLKAEGYLVLAPDDPRLKTAKIGW